MASSNFTNLADHLARAGVNFASGTFKVLLVTSVPSAGNIDAWVNRSDVTNEVAAGGGYATGGIAQTMTVGAVDTTNNRVPVTPSNIVAGWTAASISAVGAIIYLSTGTAATDKLISFVDFGGTITSTNGNYGITYTTPLYINA
jgi:hypothetical protein